MKDAVAVNVTPFVVLLALTAPTIKLAAAVSVAPFVVLLALATPAIKLTAAVNVAPFVWLEALAAPAIKLAVAASVTPLAVALGLKYSPAEPGTLTRSMSVPDQRRAIGERMVSGEGDGPFPPKISFDCLAVAHWQGAVNPDHLENITFKPLI